MSRVTFTETFATRISTSFGPGTGVGSSSMRSTSGPPNSRITIAFKALLLRQHVRIRLPDGTCAPAKAQGRRIGGGLHGDKEKQRDEKTRARRFGARFARR